MNKGTSSSANTAAARLRRLRCCWEQPALSQRRGSCYSARNQLYIEKVSVNSAVSVGLGGSAGGITDNPAVTAFVEGDT